MAESCLEYTSVRQALGVLKRLQAEDGVSHDDRQVLAQLAAWLSLADGVDGEVPIEPQGSVREYLISYREAGIHTPVARLTRDIDSPKLASFNAQHLNVSPELARELAKMDDWERFDVFAVDHLTHGHPLETVALAMLQRFDLIAKLGLRQEPVRKFFQEVEAAYNDKPYHNSMHAADVTQSVGALLATDGFSDQLTDLELLAVILASVVHDVGHPGVTNDFLIRTHADVALRYNDISVNENMHISLAFQILKRRHNDVLQPLTEEQFRFVRRLMIQIVLATDMAGHTELLKDFVASCKLLPANFGDWPDNKRALALRMLVHTADIGNPAKPLNLSQKWTQRIVQESFEQGDLERSRGLPVSILCDRERNEVPKSQMTFLEYVVKPTFEAIQVLLPSGAAKALRNVEGGRQHWEQAIQGTCNGVAGTSNGAQAGSATLT